MYVYMYMCIHIHACTCGGQRTALWSSSPLQLDAASADRPPVLSEPLNQPGVCLSVWLGLVLKQSLMHSRLV